ncbi:phosphoribosyltransferase [Spirulina subsalsa]|uniref:phosphoribosyltransferase n=1 Tax=Spirulina subsalsa TaxID=54311 RepID=UPI0002D4D987|nr:phosphoribosyltransferase family protein [Spirulina subsalsa]
MAEQTELYVSWSDYHYLVEQLAVQVYRSGWEFNQIICIAKGGLRVGDTLCRLYDYPLAILSASSYGGSKNQVRGELKFSQHLAMTTERLGDRILLLDDLVDSGISLRESIYWLKQNYGSQIQDLRTGVLWYKACSVIEPDYYVEYLSDNPWIHQPFEYYEQTTPAQLAQKYGFDVP